MCLYCYSTLGRFNGWFDGEINLIPKGQATFQSETVQPYSAQYIILTGIYRYFKLSMNLFIAKFKACMFSMKKEDGQWIIKEWVVLSDGT